MGGLVYSPQVKKRRGVQPGTTRGPYRKRGNVHKLRGGKRKDPDVLKATVMEAWDSYGISSDHIKMEKVFEKIPDIARKTIEQKGGNHFDEAKAAGARVRVVERRKAAAAVAAAAADAF